MPNKRVTLLYDGDVGKGILDCLEKDFSIELQTFTPKKWYDEYDDLGIKKCPTKIHKFNPDWLILAWWPKIISASLIGCAKNTLNIHNSFLPYCRGKHPNFWTIMEDVPYGVTLHSITTDIDAGPIYVQETLHYNWMDTGETLHQRSQTLAVDLFTRSWSGIRDEYIKPQPQKGYSTFHHSSELEDASQVVLDDTYTGKKLLNILRARQCYEHRAWFVDKGVKYNVEVKITKASV